MIRKYIFMIIIFICALFYCGVCYAVEYDQEDLNNNNLNCCYEVTFEDGSTEKTIYVPLEGCTEVNVLFTKKGITSDALNNYNNALLVVNRYYEIEREKNTFIIYRKRERNIRI